MPNRILAYGRGPLYYLTIAYAYAVPIAASYLLLRGAYQQRRSHKRQAIAILLGLCHHGSRRHPCRDAELLGYRDWIPVSFACRAPSLREPLQPPAPRCPAPWPEVALSTRSRWRYRSGPTGPGSRCQLGGSQADWPAQHPGTGCFARSMPRARDSWPVRRLRPAAARITQGHSSIPGRR